MSFEIIITRQFKKDYKRIKHQKTLMADVDRMIIKRQKGESLAVTSNAHALKGDYKDCMECHIQSDWLLIWRVNENENTITLVRTGTHSELF